MANPHKRVPATAKKDTFLDPTKTMRTNESKPEEFRKQTDYISIVFINTESAHAGALVLVSLQASNYVWFGFNTGSCETTW